MSKKPPQKPNRRKLPAVELIYRPVELGGTAQQSLDRAFDVLFEEVLRRRESIAKNIHRDILTIKDN